MKGGWKKYVYLFIIALPFIGFLIAKHYSDVNLRMPRHFMPERVGLSGDTVFHRMQDFRLVNQLGDTVRRDALDGKVTLVDFFHTRGRRYSPRLSAVLQKVQNSFLQSEDRLQIISITTDPAYDTVRILHRYAVRYGAHPEVWMFLRGPQPVVRSIAADDFHVKLQPSGSGNALSSPLIVVLDKYQHVRGYYDVRDSARVLKMVRDISLLLIEKEKPAR